MQTANDRDTRTESSIYTVCGVTNLLQTIHCVLIISVKSFRYMYIYILASSCGNSLVLSVNIGLEMICPVFGHHYMWFRQKIQVHVPKRWPRTTMLPPCAMTLSNNFWNLVDWMGFKKNITKTKPMPNLHEWLCIQVIPLLWKSGAGVPFIHPIPQSGACKHCMTLQTFISSIRWWLWQGRIHVHGINYLKFIMSNNESFVLIWYFGFFFFLHADFLHQLVVLLIWNTVQLMQSYHQVLKLEEKKCK